MNHERIEECARRLYEEEVRGRNLIGSPWGRAADEVKALFRFRAETVLKAYFALEAHYAA